MIRERPAPSPAHRWTKRKPFDSRLRGRHTGVWSDGPSTSRVKRECGRCGIEPRRDRSCPRNCTWLAERRSSHWKSVARWRPSGKAAESLDPQARKPAGGPVLTRRAGCPDAVRSGRSIGTPDWNQLKHPNASEAAGEAPIGRRALGLAGEMECRVWRRHRSRSSPAFWGRARRP
jgi:hypothetical protein